MTPSGGSDGTARILVVDDDEAQHRGLERSLTSSGFEVETAPDGLAGVHAYFEGDFDAVLMDCQMPVMDGWQAVQAIRQYDGRDVPILAFTGHDAPDLLEKCLAVGMDDVLPKRFEREFLAERLHFWIRVKAG